MSQIHRFTIRRWLIAIAVIAVFLGAGNWFRAYERVVSARREYDKQLALYDEARVTCDLVASWSRRLMDAECLLGFSTKDRIMSVCCHIRRLESLRAKEVYFEESFFSCMGNTRAYLAELDQFIEEARAILAQHR